MNLIVDSNYNIKIYNILILQIIDKQQSQRKVWMCSENWELKPTEPENMAIKLQINIKMVAKCI